MQQIKIDLSSAYLYANWIIIFSIAPVLIFYKSHIPTLYSHKTPKVPVTPVANETLNW